RVSSFEFWISSFEGLRGLADFVLQLPQQLQLSDRRDGIRRLLIRVRGLLVRRRLIGRSRRLRGEDFGPRLQRPPRRVLSLSRLFVKLLVAETLSGRRKVIH